MKVNLITKDLLKKIAIVYKIVSATKISLYESITIVAEGDQTWLYGRNSEVEVYAKVGSKIIEPGRVAILGSYLTKIAKTYPEGLVGIDGLTITAGNFTNVIAEMDNIAPTVWPKMDGLVEMPNLLSDLATFSWVDALLFTSNYLIGRDKLAHRVGIMSNVGLTGEYYIPKNFLRAISSFRGSCEVGIVQHNIVFKKDDFLIISALEEVPLTPPFIELLPKVTSAKFIPTAEVLAAVQNADGVKEGKPVNIAFSNKSVRVTAKSDMGYADINIPISKMEGTGRARILPDQFIAAFGRAFDVIYHEEEMLLFENKKNNYVEIISEYIRNY